MKLINPFDRLKKRENVPLSLFPANKITRTTMPIGRAVPLYCIDMMQGNRLKLSVDQLTRFMEMNGPVMQNYEVTYGAFFVPDVSFDRCFQSSWFRQNAGLTDVQQKLVLSMRDFFNPATADSLRVHPAKISIQQVDGTKVGSLYNHLGYPTYGIVEFHNSSAPFANPSSHVGFYASITLLTSQDGVTTEKIYISPDDMFISPLLGGVVTYLSDNTRMGTIESMGYKVINSGALIESQTECLPFALWAINKSGIGSNLNKFTLYYDDGTQTTTYGFTYFKNGVATNVSYIKAFDIKSTDGTDPELQLAVLYNIRAAAALYGLTVGDINNSDAIYDTYKSDAPKFKDFWPNSRMEDLYQEYRQYISDNLNLQLYGEQKFNLRRWLAYNMIYADYFLNPIYTAREDFTDMIGCGYISLAQGTGMQTSFNSYNKKVAAKPDLKFFADYIANGECYPVLWKKDQLTSIVQTDASADVAIGSTIKENFYNRCYAKFKDLIARLGQDYRTNTSALYGHKINDASLLRSQVIGYKSFDVQIGEIAQTSQSTENSSLGQFAGYALSHNRERNNLFDWTADENGQIMVLCWIRPKYVAISNMIDRSILKDQYLDYLLPEFGGVGYQDVSAYQLDIRNIDTANSKVGIQERYSEYMSVPNEVSGLMLTSMSYLNADRLDENIYSYDNGSNPDWYKNLYMWNTDALHRIFQVQDIDPVAVAAFFSGNVTRQLPAFIRTDF